MRSVNVWADKVHDKEGKKQPIYAIAFKPDGTQLVAAAGSRVLVYETADGELVTSLKGHKNSVYCLAFQKDGKRFASGGADKMVIIWTDELEGILKYSHNDAIQAIAFNPRTNLLCSCTASDFGFWSADIKSVNKIKVPSRITTCSWTNDGQYIALGMFSGQISIRNEAGDEKVVIQGKTAPVWAMQWNPSLESSDVLAVCDWDQKMSFYLLSGRPAKKERQLDYDPCCISHFSSGEFIVAGGSDSKASLYTHEGVKLHTIVEQEGWVWCTAVRPKQNYVAVGCNDGTIALYQLIFSTVHGLYKDRYAYRKDMTEVVIQDLTSQSEARVRCRDLVKKIAIYKDRLAVQLPNQISVYDVVDDNGTAKIKIRDRIKKKFECNLLVVCSEHVILCQERRLQCLSFNGLKEREWTMDSKIRYIKVSGGPRGREGLLVGLANGLILKIFVDNAFPIELIKQQTAVRCLDLSASRKKLAVVDDNNTCLVYDLQTKDLLFQEPHANSVAWNTQAEDMLCFSGHGMLHIKAADFPVNQQKMQGFVVGFSGSQIYCLHVYAMTAVEVPQSTSMFQYLKKKMYPEAYKVACLGVTETDWRALAMEALEGMEISVAKNAFIRVRDLRYLELIYAIEERQRRGEDDPEAILADIYAYQGRFDDAAKIYSQTGQSRKAVDMFCDLRLFDKAKEYLDPNDAEAAAALMRQQTKAVVHEISDPVLAIEVLRSAGEELQSVDIMGENGMTQRLIDTARSTNKEDEAVLRRIAHWLKKLDQVPLAAEVLQKIPDVKGLVELYVSSSKWDDAFALASRHPEHKQEIFLPYASWLAENDRFEEAQKAFRDAGMEEKAIEVLEVLTHNAVVEKRFNDAGYYYWQLSVGCLQALSAASRAQNEENNFEVNAEPDERLLKKYEQYKNKAEMYHAYHAVYRYIEEPFTSHLPESLFHMACFLLHALQREVPRGVSKVYMLFALAKQSRNLGAFKLARHAYEKLQALKVPDAFRESIDLGAITIRAKPFTDKEDIAPLCYRCSTPNPLISTVGHACFNCRQPFVYSFYSFENLPLVEFFIDIDIPDAEAVRLIGNDSIVEKRSNWREARSGESQIMSLNSGADEQDADDFNEQLMRFEPGNTMFEPVRVNRSTLRAMPSSEVFVQRWPAPLPFRYFRNVLPEVGVAMCDTCFMFFHSYDYELQVLRKNCCPFCRTPRASNTESTHQPRGVAIQNSGSSTA
eukprot:m.65502 g.65502  ORF g.65502 m.65502 type:complete len:1216 (+) comp16496_c0_seq1:48-3695(+)